MKLLSDKELSQSDIVANNRMNRSRNASGINSYEQEFRTKPNQLLEEFLKRKNTVSWLDCCCGEGKALIQSAQWLQQKGWQSKAQLLGIDLVDYFLPTPSDIHCLRFETIALTDWIPSQKFDLITCVHGLHYIGDKLKVISTAIQALAEDGVFIANFDLASIAIDGDPTGTYIRKLFKQQGIDYKARTKMLFCQGPSTLPYQLQYLGADDQAGPNYTGQPAVKSYYSK